MRRWATLLTIKTVLELKKRDGVPARVVLEIAERNGFVDRGEFTPSYLNRIFRDRGVGRKQRRQRQVLEVGSPPRSVYSRALARALNCYGETE